MKTVLLLDAFYGHEAQFRDWLRSGQHRLAMVSKDTADEAAVWLKRIPWAVRRAHCPDRFDSLTVRERRTRLLAMGTGADHMGIVTEGKILPLLLRWSGLPG